ncbi:hypothetical protein A2W24_03175 [Microgenomates group bacterium RBG_16_45_19]|nr:MAG: hypothetical protein A2W24_03175 [Microgenomates group bacterium RBG_16_45_19]
MRLTFFTPYFYPYVSGMTTFPLLLLKHWAKTHQVEVITFAYQPQLALRQSLGRLTIYRLRPTLRLHKGFISLSAGAFFADRVRQTDLVLTNLPNFEGWPLVWLAKRHHKPVLALYHCRVDLGPGLVNRLLHFGLDASVAFQLKTAQLIIGTSPDYLQSQPQLAPYLNKCQAIYPPMPPLTVSRPALAHFLQLKGKRRWLGFVGRIAREKGLIYLADALHHLPHRSRYELVMAGPEPAKVAGETKFYRQFITRLKHLGLTFRHFGYLSPNALSGFYQALDVLVLPSLNSTEAFGQVQVEAMQLGTPVIASALPGVRLPVQATGMGLLVAPHQSQALAQALHQVITRREIYTSAAQRDLAKRLFNYRLALKQYDQALAAVTR